MDFNVFNAQFTRQHGTFHAVFRTQAHTGKACYRHLRAGMQRQLRHKFARQVNNAHVLHDNAINAHVI